MKARHSNWWRTAVAVTFVIAVGALSPVTGFAQESPGPSGAAVEVGGVGATTPGGPQSSSPVGGARGQSLVLPNTGTGPTDESNNNRAAVLAGFGGLIAAGAGVYLHRRRAKTQIGA